MSASGEIQPGDNARLPGWIHPNLLTRRFWVLAAVWTILLSVLFTHAARWVGAHYRIGLDTQQTLCLNNEARVFLIVRSNPDRLWRGDIVAFAADRRMEPFFPSGTIVVKYLAAVPGDRVRVDRGGVRVNGVQVASGLVHAAKLNRHESSFYREEIVPPAHYFVIGTHPKSFDSRYWGLVRQNQLLGKAIPLATVTSLLDLLARFFLPQAQAREFLEAAKAIRDRTRSIEAGELAGTPQNFHLETMEALAKEAGRAFQIPDPKALREALETASPAPALDRKKTEELGQKLLESLNQTVRKASLRRFVVLVSSSLGEARLKEMFSAYADRQDTIFAFQGLLEGQRIEDFAATVHRWLQGMDPQPSVVLDPLVFRDHAIGHVPVVLALEGNRLLAKIEGLVNIEWIEDQLASAKEKLPLTRRLGQVVAISERNLMEIIEERLAAIDWEEKRRGAIKRFWSHQKRPGLPPALQDRTRLIDMRVKLPKDVVTPDGKLIAQAGQVFSPLEKIAFRQGLLVFDATRQAEVEWAKVTLHEVIKDGLVPLLIATRLPAGKESETIESIESSTGFPVYLMPEILKVRFRIEYSPSLITPHDTTFVQISEFKLCADCS